MERFFIKSFALNRLNYEGMRGYLPLYFSGVYIGKFDHAAVKHIS